MCVSCIYRGNVGNADTCREQRDGCRSDRVEDFFLHGGEKSGDGLGRIRSGHFDKSRFARQIKRGSLLATCVSSNTLRAAPSSVRALCICKDVEDVENTCNIFFSVLQMYYMRKRYTD